MKRAWDSSYPNPTEDWAAHPYATAYQNLSMQYTGPHQATTSLGGGVGGGQYDAFAAGPSSSSDKKPKVSTGLGTLMSLGEGDAGERDSDGDDDDEDDEDEEDDADGVGASGKKDGAKGKPKLGKDGKPKVKMTRGSRACIACRKIKMRCIPDVVNPSGPCKRCKSGGHECIFEESNRGKRSTRKNEALAARLAKMESALKGIGAALSNIDQPSLNSFSTALHSNVSAPDTINLITSYTTPATVPTLAVPMNRTFIHADTYVGGYGAGEGGGGLSHMAASPLSPRLHSLPDNVLSPLGLLAEASLQNNRKNSANRLGRPSLLSQDSAALGRKGSNTGQSGVNRVVTSDVRGNGPEEADDKGEKEDGKVKEEEGEGKGVASQNYFRPHGIGIHVGPPDNRLPELLTIVKREEINELFKFFYDNMAVHVPLIYKEFHTPDLVLQRSQFLCTVICAIAARFYTKKPELNSSLSAYAKRLAFEVPSRGYKSVEVVQAYLLLSLWTLGPEKTMATDLNLHRKSLPSNSDTEEGRARDLEIINRERCWIHCYILDRSISAQMGKPYTIREDYIIRNACEKQWHTARFSLASDKAVAAYAMLQAIMSRIIDSIYSSTTTVSGLRADCDYMLIVRSAHEELRRWMYEWNKPETLPDLDVHFEWDSRAQFYFAYHSLVLYSFGLENALERNSMDIAFFLTNVHEAATRVCQFVKDQFVPKGYLPYVPDTNFVMCSYALLSLLKLLKPELRPYHDNEEAIFKLVEEMADHLESCAVDSSHQPAIYAAFIREIVRKTKEAKNQPSLHPSRANSPGTTAAAIAAALGGAGANGTIDPALTAAGTAGLNGSGQNGTGAEAYDPQLLDHQWTQPEMGQGSNAAFTYVPQGGDMMILPSAVGPSESVQNSPSATFAAPHYYGSTPSHGPGAPGATGGAAGGSAAGAGGTGAGVGVMGANGWAEYLPTFMQSDSFDGWDGSMLLPGFGRGQITLGGGLLHSQFGSGLM